MEDQTPNLRQSAALRSLKSNCPLLAHSCWDAIPVALAVAHGAAVVALVGLVPRAELAGVRRRGVFVRRQHLVKAAGVRVINRAHALAFLDRSLPAR